MGEKITLDLQPREVRGKKVARLRREGLVPGVVYGSGLDPVTVMAPANVVEKVCSQAGKHHPVYVTVNGKRRIAMIKDIDLDPVKRFVRHVSFHAVKQNEKVEAEVPVRLVGEGESAAEKAGLIVLQTIEHLEVSALPMDLPDALEVSIVDLAEPGDRVTVADIKLPANVELVEHVDQAHQDDNETPGITDLVVASVYEPSALQAANEQAGGTAAPEDVENVDAEHGEDTPQDTQAEEDQPGGKAQNQPKGD